MWETLPARYRDNLTHLHILHCDSTLWAATLGLLPLWSAGLRQRIAWARRVEDLWDAVDRRELGPRLPGYVMEHGERKGGGRGA